MKITVIGTGYVGLVTGTCLAEVGNDVLCLDLDAYKIDILKGGGVHIHEPGLLEMVRQNVDAGRLHFSTSIEESVAFGQVQFIAVGTPPDEDGSADLQYVIEAATNIARHMTDYKVVVDKSTVPVGTGEKVCAAMGEELQKRGLKIPFSVVSNPEFLKEGNAVSDFMRPDRIVIGADNEHAVKLLREIYAPFTRNHDRLIVMDIKSAELTKYAANCMLATRISFMNEMANLADKLGADIEQVRLGIGSDPRIGYHFLYPGCGYGGSCFPKDVQAMIRMSCDIGKPLKVLNAVNEANEAQKGILLEKIKSKFGCDLTGRHFALWGLAFKPNTDDMRDASSRVVIQGLCDLGATVTAYDPVAMTESKRIFGTDIRLSYADSATKALVNADALIIVTEWKVFFSVSFTEIKALLKLPVIFDGRNIFEPSKVKESGIEYFAIGRRT